MGQYQVIGSLIGLLEWERTEEIFEEIKAENFSNMMTAIQLQRLDQTKRKHEENHNKAHHNRVPKDL